jgi:Flp pilus assembly protein TadB
VRITKRVEGKNTGKHRKEEKEMKSNTQERKEGWLSAILYLIKLFSGYWALMLGVVAVILVLSYAYEKFGIIIILIPIFIALFSYHLWLKRELQSLKDEVLHLRDIGSWSKEERQYFLERLKE